MRAHRNPTRMRCCARVGWKLAKRLQRLCPKCHAPGFGAIGSRRGLPCEGCGEPTHWIDFEIDGCSACGHAEARPRKDGRKTAPRLSCSSCKPKALSGQPPDTTKPPEGGFAPTAVEPYGPQFASTGTIPVAVTAKVVGVELVNFT